MSIPDISVWNGVLTFRHLRLKVPCMRDQLFEFVITGLEKRRADWNQISEATGLSTKTFERMLAGENNNRRDTLITLANHFEANPLKPARAR